MQTSIVPHRVICCCFIKNIITTNIDKDAWSDEVSHHDTQRRYFIAAMKLMQNTAKSWQEFETMLKSVVESDLFSKITTEIYQLTNLEHLMNAFVSFEALFDDCELLLKKSSILGLFVRKTILEFKKMPFEHVVILAKSIQSYLMFVDNQYQPLDKEMNVSTTEDTDCSMELSAFEEKENIDTTISVQVPQTVLSANGDIFISRNKAVRFITEQAHFLEHNDNVAMSPCELQHKLEKIHQKYPEIYESFYLSFLNYLRVGEINRATVMLQKFFDHKVFNTEKGEEEITSLEKHQMKFKRFRYCALNLGVMHCCHGNYSEALLSLEEAIRVAQETNDQQCLNHAMFWLSLVKEEHSSMQDGIDHLKQFIAETAKDILKSEGNVTSQMIDYLGVLRLIKIQTLKGTQTPAKLLSTVSQLVISNPLISNTGQLVLSTMLNFYGFCKISLMMCQLPFQQLHNFTDLHSSFAMSEEDLAISLCQLSTHIHMAGFYNDALSVLAFSENRFSLHSPYRRKIQLCSASLKFQQQIALRNVDNIKSLANSIQILDEYEGQYAMAVSDIMVGNFTKASNDLQMFLEQFQVHSTLMSAKPILKVKLTLLLVEIQLLSSNPSQSVSAILDLLTFVKSRYMAGLELDVQISLTRYLLLTEFIDKANSVIDELILGGLANGSCYQQGMLYYLKSKCLLEQGKKMTGEKQRLQLLQVLPLLHKSFEFFHRIECKALLKEIYLEQALVYHQLEQVGERNKASTHYRLLHEQLSHLPKVMLF